MNVQDSEPRYNWSRFVPLAFLSVYALLCISVWTEPDWRPGWDSAIYLLTATSLAEGGGYTYLGQPFFLRPPGFSWLLSLRLSDGGFDFESINRMVMFFAATTTIATYSFVSLRHSRWIAIVTALLAGTSPLFVRNFNMVMSEFPFMTMLIPGIALLECARRKESKGWAHGVAGALFIVAALYFRSAALLLLPGMLAVAIQASRDRMKLWSIAPIAIVVLLASPWLLYADHAASAGPVPNEQLLLHSYSTAMLHLDAGDPASAFLSLSDWLQRIEGNGGRLIGDLGQLAHFRPSLQLGWMVWPFGAILIVLVSIGMIDDVRQGLTLGGWFSAIYLLFILTYFRYSHRLLLPLVPFLYLYLVAGCKTAYELLGASGVSWLARPGVAGIVPAAALLLSLLVNLSGWPDRLTPQNWFSEGPSAEKQPRIGYVAAKWILNNTAPDAVILSRHAPVIEVLTGRRAFTYRFARDENLLDRYPVDYALFQSADQRDFPLLYERLASVARGRSQLLPKSRARRIEIFKITDRQ